QDEMSRPLGLYEPISIGPPREEDAELAYLISQIDPEGGFVPARGKQTAIEWLALGSALPISWDLDRRVAERALSVSASVPQARWGGLARTLLAAGSLVARGKSDLPTLFRGAIALDIGETDMRINLTDSSATSGTFTLYADEEDGTRRK